MTARYRVLIVDDSAFARKVVREILERSGRFEVVGVARDGLEALESIAELAPDVVTLDLMMPQLDGIGVLEALPDGAPPTVLVTVSGSDTNLGAAALLKGGVDIVEKPSALAVDRLYEMGGELVAKVLAAASARSHPAVPRAEPLSLPERATPFSLVAIGASTGGPQAISKVLTSLPADLPVPIVVALHIPDGYTKALAERIADSARMPVLEGSDGMQLEPSTAVIAPGGHCSEVVRWKDRLRLAVSNASRSIRSFAPNIDRLFASAAHAAPPVLGVVLTGMGGDGVEGARAIRNAGGEIITESEESCIVYGMPRAVQLAGQSDGSMPLDRIAGWVESRLTQPTKTVANETVSGQRDS